MTPQGVGAALWTFLQPVQVLFSEDCLEIVHMDGGDRASPFAMGDASLSINV